MEIFKSKRINQLFHSSYTVTPDGCWKWRLTTPSGNIQQIAYKNSTMSAAHYSYQIHYGIFPKHSRQWMIYKRCGNLACVNPDHLYLAKRPGTRKRALKKLPPFAFDMIRSADIPAETLAELFGLSVIDVFKIKDGSLSIV
jgi:hypothetical protein